jgi:ubiquinone/menaquinone biosynthesis C-methylase UbiE
MSTNQMVVHWAARYDLLIWLLTLGRERRFREKLLEPARLQNGEGVLDVGCGTGALALAAKRRVGPAGTVHGIDAGLEMIARAKHKASRASLDICFHMAHAQSLPFPDAQFDVVLSTVMLHHLPRKVRPQALREMRRVLKPGGRLLAVDFGGFGNPKSLIGRLHHHSGVTHADFVSQFSDAGFTIAESGPVGTWDLQFVLART